jgi:hypothetical protein
MPLVARRCNLRTKAAAQMANQLNEVRWPGCNPAMVPPRPVDDTNAGSARSPRLFPGLADGAAREIVWSRLFQARTRL